MDVLLSGIDYKSFNNIKDENIVNVKVIERNNDNIIIDIHGNKIKAKTLTNIPDNFFALIQIDNKENKIFLRILNLSQNNENIIEWNKNKLFEKIENFLYENNLPINETYIKIMYFFYQNGIEWDIEKIKLFNKIILKYNDYDLLKLIIKFLDNGIKINDNLIDFFLNINTLYKNFLNKKIKKNNSDNINIKNILIKDDDEVDFLKLFILNLFNYQNINDYEIAIVKDNILQLKNDFKQKRLYVEIDGAEIGKNLLIIDYNNENKYIIKLFLNNNLYVLINNKMVDNIIKILKFKTFNKDIYLEIKELRNKYLFWIEDENECYIEQKLLNLDISI